MGGWAGGRERAGGCVAGDQDRPWFPRAAPRPPPRCVVLHSGTDTLFWGLPGDVLAAPASALCGWAGRILCLSLSLSPLQCC